MGVSERGTVCLQLKQHKGKTYSSSPKHLASIPKQKRQVSKIYMDF